MSAICIEGWPVGAGTIASCHSSRLASLAWSAAPVLLIRSFPHFRGSRLRVYVPLSAALFPLPGGLFRFCDVEFWVAVLSVHRSGVEGVVCLPLFVSLAFFLLVLHISQSQHSGHM